MGRDAERASIGLMMLAAVGAFLGLAAGLLHAIPMVPCGAGSVRSTTWPFWGSLAISLAAFWCGARKTRDPRTLAGAGRALLVAAGLLWLVGCGVNR